jgi:glutamate synthase (NADPH/NADH) large chain
VMADMTGHDAERLHRLIANHARFTGSVRARAILDNWSEWLPKFRKVMPVEYRRALAEMKAQESAQPRLGRAAE